MPAGSRWLSEPRATPPEPGFHRSRIPVGRQRPPHPSRQHSFEIGTKRREPTDPCIPNRILATDFLPSRDLSMPRLLALGCGRNGNVFPVVSLRSTTGYLISSLREGETHTARRRRAGLPPDVIPPGNRRSHWRASLRAPWGATRRRLLDCGNSFAALSVDVEGWHRAPQRVRPRGRSPAECRADQTA